MGESVMEYNGGSVLAMAGKGCVAFATDLRFGVRSQTVAFDHAKIYRMNDSIFVGLPGLISDAQTLYEKLKFRLNTYELSEEREMKPSTFASILQSMLYAKRFGPFFVEPVVCGLEGNKPYLCAMDLIGAGTSATDFVTSGTSSRAIFGLAETLWRPNMDPEELFETTSQTFLSALDRDAISGWGARVYLLTEDRITCRDLKARQD
ncbi:proteasome subunit beta type-3-like [Schistocerca gregaria]|uniref:proteasome subunit beta type-3-like n=1 Tax=Schistocerca gregaria TaxID=7010 RepID=UPI00211DF618|nr:proteasome subunit beta type-3-like [Schistocerca gregaria]